MPLTPVQQQVADRLKSVGASLFVPLVGADDVHLAVRGAEGQYIEVRILEPRDGPRAFTMDRFRPKPHVFFVCVVPPAAPGEPTETWVLPSGAFERFASGQPGASSRTLDLDFNDLGEPLGERLRIYRDRWVLISEYRKYRSTFNDPAALQLMISMG
jgi:hypothetical protein